MLDEAVLSPADNVAIKIADFGLARSQESEVKNEMTNTLGTYVRPKKKNVFERKSNNDCFLHSIGWPRRFSIINHTV